MDDRIIAGQQICTLVFLLSRRIVQGDACSRWLLRQMKWWIVKAGDSAVSAVGGL
jgi:hypothetical protein